MPNTNTDILDEKRGLVILSALINFVDWLNAQGVLVTNVSEPEAERLRGQLVLEFLKAHAESENYFMQADQIAEMLGAPFQEQEAKSD